MTGTEITFSHQNQGIYSVGDWISIRRTEDWPWWHVWMKRRKPYWKFWLDTYYEYYEQHEVADVQNHTLTIL